MNNKYNNNEYNDYYYKIKNDLINYTKHYNRI